MTTLLAAPWLGYGPKQNHGEDRVSQRKHELRVSFRTQKRARLYVDDIGKTESGIDRFNRQGYSKLLYKYLTIFNFGYGLLTYSI